MARVRKEKFDNRRRVDFTDTQADFLDSMSAELNVSFMAVVRKLVDEKMKQLSANDELKTTSITGINSARSKVLPTGLFTAEAVAQLLNAMGKK